MNVTALRERAEVKEQQADWVPELPEDFQRLLDADLDAVPDARWAESLRELMGHQVGAFVRLGYDKMTALRLARVAVLALADAEGGRQVYLPNLDAVKVALRDIEIYRRANRDNIEALAREYGLTVRSILRIVHRQRRLHLDKIQGKLAFVEAADSVNGG